MKVRLYAAAALATLLAAGTLSLAVAPACAQTPIGEDPLDDRSRRRLDNMEKVMRELRAMVIQGRETGKPVVVQPAETDALIFSLTTRIDDLEQSLRRMTGENEVLTRDLGAARGDLTAARSRADTLDQRLTALEKKAADLEAAAAAAQVVAVDPALSATPGAAPAAPAGAAGASANDTFAKARQLLNEGDNAGAEAGFADYVARFGTTPRAAEARYWLGKTLTARRANADAADNYLAAVRGWPQTTWAPDALVELSRSLLALGNATGACQTLAELPRRYPKAPPAVAGRAATTRTQAKCAA